MAGYKYNVIGGIAWLDARPCPVCGKIFEPTKEWAYKIGTRYFCGYSCYSKKWKKLGKKRKRTREIISETNLKQIFRDLEKGVSQHEIARNLGIRYESIHYYYYRYFLRGERPKLLNEEEA